MSSGKIAQCYRIGSESDSRVYTDSNYPLIGIPYTLKQLKDCWFFDGEPTSRLKFTGGGHIYLHEIVKDEILSSESRFAMICETSRLTPSERVRLLNPVSSILEIIVSRLGYGWMASYPQELQGADTEMAAKSCAERYRQRVAKVNTIHVVDGSKEYIALRAGILILYCSSGYTGHADISEYISMVLGKNSQLSEYVMKIISAGLLNKPYEKKDVLSLFSKAHPELLSY